MDAVRVLSAGINSGLPTRLKQWECRGQLAGAGGAAVLSRTFLT